MFFGGGQKSEDVALAQLQAKLDELFDKKLERFSSRAGQIFGRIDPARERFLEECERFESLQAEPVHEHSYRFVANLNYIKSQRTAYVAALKRIAGRRISTGTGTVHAKYSGGIAELNAAINEVLKTNAAYKEVLMSYSNHLDGFKAAFSRVQELSSSLSAELAKVDKELAEYNDVKGHLYKLSEMMDEIGVTQEELIAMRQAPQRQSREGVVNDLRTKLSAKQAETKAAGEKIHQVSSRVEMLLVPLSKAARLYDHGSPRKAKLSDLISNPVEAFASEEGFAEFLQMLGELEGDVGSGRIDVKDRQRVLSAISEARTADLRGTVLNLELLGREKSAAEGEARSISDAIDDISSESRNAEERAAAMTKLNGKVDALKASLQAEKTEVERLLLGYYKRKVSILLA